MYNESFDSPMKLHGSDFTAVSVASYRAACTDRTAWAYSLTEGHLADVRVFSGIRNVNAFLSLKSS